MKVFGKVSSEVIWGPEDAITLNPLYMHSFTYMLYKCACIYMYVTYISEASKKKKEKEVVVPWTPRGSTFPSCLPSMPHFHRLSIHIIHVFIYLFLSLVCLVWFHGGKGKKKKTMQNKRTNRGNRERGLENGRERERERTALCKFEGEEAELKDRFEESSSEAGALFMGQ